MTVNYKWDIEETAEELDSIEGDPVNFWEKKQRELITSTVDYNLSTLADLIQTKSIDLSPKYQRRFRWDDVRQSKLIESFLMNVPVPPVFLNEDTYGQYSVIDGKQRLSAIYEFLRGRLKLQGLEIFSDINGMTFDDLPKPLQSVIKTRPTLRAIIILRQSDDDVKFEVFQRLNTGGVRLNAQEIRNSAYPGPFNDLVLELSLDKKFHRLLGIKKKEDSAIYQEMRDAELVLRYFTFRDTWDSFSGGVKRYLDRFMVHSQNMPEKQVELARRDFLHTLEIVEACFNEYAFQRWLPEKQQWRKQILAALFDAQMFACRGRNLEAARSAQPQVLSKFKQLFENSDFRRSIDASTNAPVALKTRVSMLKNMLDDILGVQA